MRFWVWSRWDVAKPVGGRVLYALMLSAIASYCYGAASDPTIEVRGNRRIDAQVIREHFHAAPVALSAPSAINAALKELYATGLFEDVKIVTSGARLIVTVVEAPVIGENLIYFVSMTRVTVTNDKCLTFQERAVAPRGNTHLLF